MKERRRSHRIPVCLEVQLKRSRWERHITDDVSRRGLFVRVVGPCPVAQLMQVRIVLPHQDQPLEMLAKVARRLASWEALEAGRLPGVGLEFFCLSNQVIQQWDRFIQAAIRHLDLDPTIDAYELYRRIEQEPLAESAGAGAGVGAGEGGGAGEGANRGAARGKRCPGTESDNRANLIYRVQNVERLEQFLQEELTRGELKLQIPYRMEEEAAVNLRVIHPRTQEEFILPGFIQAGHQGGYSVRFTEPSASTVPGFRQFVATGQV